MESRRFEGEKEKRVQLRQYAFWGARILCKKYRYIYRLNVSSNRPICAHNSDAGFEILDAEWMGEVKSVIFSKQCVKCNISAHFERSSYCSNCHKEEFPVMICGCSRGYCVLCFFPQLTQTPKINGFCYTCNRLICDQCSSCKCDPDPPPLCLLRPFSTP